MIRMPALCLAVALSALLPFRAAAQEDEAEYARGLAQRGWFDAAETICRKIEQGGKPEAKGAVAFVRAEIMIAKASREADADKGKALYNEAIAILEKFVKDFPTHALLLDARINIGWLRARLAKFLTDAMEQQTDTEQIAGLSKEARKLYDDAEKYYRALLDELSKMPRTEALEDSIMNTRFEIGRTMYEHARIPQLPDADRKRLLADAVKMLVDFQWDYGNQAMGFKGALVEGQCHIELADFKTAEARMRNAISLREKLRENGMKPNAFHQEIIFSAYVGLAKLYNRQGKPTDAIAAIDQALPSAKTADSKDWEGLLMLEKAEAMVLQKNPAGAIKIATEIQKNLPQLGGLAKRKMDEWSAKGGGGLVKVTPDQMMTSADTSIDQGKYREALVALRRCLEAIVSEEEKQKYGASSWYKIGACYQELRRNYEAATAYEQVFTLFPKHELAASACSYAIDCYNAEFSVSGSKGDGDAMDRLLNTLVGTFKDTPEAKGATFTLAQKADLAGDRKKAIELYQQVDPASPKFEEALIWAGIALRADANDKQKKAPKDAAVQAEVKDLLMKADGLFQKFLARQNDKSLVPKQPELVKRRAKLVSIAYEQAARIYNHELVGRAEDCLKMLDQWARTMQPDDEGMGKCWSLQIEAHLALNRLKEAVKTLDAMFDRFPDGVNIARGCKMVADRLNEATDELRKTTPDSPEIKENLARICRYYNKWIEEGLLKGLATSLRTVVEVGKILYFAAKEINGLGPDVVSFVDLKDKAVLERQVFNDAALFLTNLVEERLGKLAPADRIDLATRLARCYSFIAADSSDWSRAKEKYDDILKSFKLLDSKGQVDQAVLAANPGLLDIYIELGSVYLALARANPKENRFQFDNANEVFVSALRFLSPGSERFWSVRYTGLLIYVERGEANDIKLASVSLDSLERSYPEFDGDKYGMKTRFLALKAKLASLRPK